MKRCEIVWDNIPSNIDVKIVVDGFYSILPREEYKIICSDVISFDGGNENDTGSRRRLEVVRSDKGLCQDRYIRELNAYVAGIKLGLYLAFGEIDEGDDNKEPKSQPVK